MRRDVRDAGANHSSGPRLSPRIVSTGGCFPAIGIPPSAAPLPQETARDSCPAGAVCGIEIAWRTGWMRVSRTAAMTSEFARASSA